VGRRLALIDSSFFFKDDGRTANPKGTETEGDVFWENNTGFSTPTTNGVTGWVDGITSRVDGITSWVGGITSWVDGITS